LSADLPSSEAVPAALLADIEKEEKGARIEGNGTTKKNKKQNWKN